MRRIAVVAFFLVSACGGSIMPAAPPPLTVYAAASLTDSFKALGASFEQAPNGVTVRFNFAGTPTLVTQIEQGAQADVFASADTANMDRLRADGLTSGEPRVFAHNKLEIAVAPGNPKRIASLADLARPEVVYISAAPTVPAGKYAGQALAKAGVAARSRSFETDVKSVLAKIELGEADAGIVYVTDVRAAGAKVQGVPIPDAYNVVATYPFVEVKGAKNPTVARMFIAYVLSGEGQSKLVMFGFD